MSPKPSSSAIALAATLTSLSAAAQEPAEAARQSTDPLSAPIPPPPPAKQQRKAVRRAEERYEEQEEQPLRSVDWAVEPFAFIGPNFSLITTSLASISLPRIAPHLGAGVRFNQAAPHSVQLEASLDFLGGTYYFYGVAWYTLAATYLSVPLLARHRISTSPSKTKHFTWGLQFSQKIGESYNFNILGVPLYVESGAGSYYAGSSFFNTRALSLAIGYQARRATKRGGMTEFEMRLNVGLTNFGEEDTEGVSNFNFRWNFVPRKPRQ